MGSFPSKRFAPLSEIYSHPELIILTRCEEYAAIIENAWNVTVDRIIYNYEFFNQDFIDYLESKVKEQPYVFPEPIPEKSVLSYLE